jgi:hypothetical protein
MVLSSYVAVSLTSDTILRGYFMCQDSSSITVSGLLKM